MSPDNLNSSTLDGYSPAQTFIFSANSSLTMLTTNSPVARMFTMVSLGGLRQIGLKHTTGGSPQTTLKKLNGARL